jgi:AcrR family transcriptional regulator
MHMTGQKKRPARRSYAMGRRQEQLDSMRLRITEAALELHASLGPAQTSISAIAERAGVQRHTVYHHFPDMTSLMQACTAHGMRTTGIPDPASWVAIEDPTARLRHGLGELYAYYAANARLLGNVVRDMPLLGEKAGVEEFTEHMTGLFYALAAGWVDSPDSQRLRMAAIGHAMAFETWRSLTGNGLSDAEASELMVGFVSTAGESAGKSADSNDST